MDTGDGRQRRRGDKEGGRRRGKGQEKRVGEEKWAVEGCERRRREDQENEER